MYRVGKLYLITVLPERSIRLEGYEKICIPFYIDSISTRTYVQVWFFQF